MILVTGATGFVGNALVHKLAALQPLKVSVRKISANIPKNVEIARAELAHDQDWTPMLMGVDTIVHCAARVHVMNEQATDPLTEFRRVNVEGTLQLGRQAAKAGVRRFIFISSVKVNGEATELPHPFTADDVSAPQDPYGVSKMEAEQVLRELSAKTGMEVVIIRPPLVYGFGVKANFATMMRWLQRGVPLPLGGIKTNRRSLIYIENLTDMITVCVNHPKAANQTFLVSDDEDVSTATLLHKMAIALGCPAHLINISPKLIKLLAKCIGKPEIADRLCGSLCVDIAKTKDLLDWEPKYSLDEGLLRTARSAVTICNN